MTRCEPTADVTVANAPGQLVSGWWQTVARPGLENWMYIVEAAGLYAVRSFHVLRVLGESGRP